MKEKTFAEVSLDEAACLPSAVKNASFLLFFMAVKHRGKTVLVVRLLVDLQICYLFASPWENISLVVYPYGPRKNRVGTGSLGSSWPHKMSHLVWHDHSSGSGNLKVV